VPPWRADAPDHPNLSNYSQHSFIPGISYTNSQIYQYVALQNAIAPGHICWRRLDLFGDTLMIFLLALLIGVVAGLRAMLALAAVSWAAQLGAINLSGTWLAFLGYHWTPWVLSVAAIAELVTDQLPFTPSRKVPQQFGARIVAGALSGAAIAAPSGAWIGGAVAGIAGAVAGTFGGAAARAWLAAAIGNDRPAAIIEDAVALVGTAAILVLVR
jgi:uncharacterized membrane protein